MAQESRPTPMPTRDSDPDDDLDSPSDWSEEAPTVIAPLPGWKPASADPVTQATASAPPAVDSAASSSASPTSSSALPAQAPTPPVQVAMPVASSTVQLHSSAPGAAAPKTHSTSTSGAGSPIPDPPTAAPKLSDAAEAILARARARSAQIGDAPRAKDARPADSKPKDARPADSKAKNARPEPTSEAEAARLGLEALLARAPEKRRSEPIASRMQLPDVLRSGLNDKDLAIFTRQLATMVNSGLPLYQCLEVLHAQTTHPLLKSRLEAVKKAVSGGATFSDALRRQPDLFDGLYVSLVEAGEASGTLDVILLRLANYIEKANELKKQVKTAMVYPIAVLVVAIVVIALLVLKVVPVFERMFSGVGQQLPVQTQVAIAISGFFKDYFFLLVGLLALAVAGLTAMYRSARGRYTVDRLLLRAPVAGDLVRKVAVARFCRTLSTLISSGVPLLSGMDICSRIAGNRVVEAAIQQARRGVSEGRTLSRPLQSSGVFPEMVCQMITVGETTGSLDAMLSKIADFYEEEVESTVTALASLIEPAMMIFLGVVIGGLLIAMYMPIFSMSTIVGGGG